MDVIVVATDGSSAATAALEHAIGCAQVMGDRIAVITVWRALQGDYGVPYPTSAQLPDLLACERTHAESALADAVALCEVAGVAVTTRLATGDPAERICAYAAELGARLIGVGTKGHGPMVQLVVGSVSAAVIQASPCPVVVTKAGGDDTSEPLALATQGVFP